MSDPEQWKEKGNAAFQAAEYLKAVQYYTQGIELEPTNRALFSNRSAAYLKIEDYAKAKLDAKICIDLDRTWPKGWWRLGTAQLEDKDYEAAKATFTEGLKVCAGDTNLKNGLDKAQKYIDVLASVQTGEGGEEYDLDGPATKKEEGAGAGEGGGMATGAKLEDSFPASAEEEIQRIKKAPNHYAVLHVSPEASNAQLKKNYYTLARILHPDKCQLPGAEDAMTDVSLAYDTLTNVIKKTLYDQYMSQTGDTNDGAQQTYAEWEAKQQPMELPKWLAFLLGIKGCGWFLAILIIIVLFPLVVVLLVVFFIIWIILLPYRLTLRFCFPERYEQMKQEREKDLAKMEEEAQDRMYAHV